jgi:glycosyltransferase involved in cell wall biosynthesis
LAQDSSIFFHINCSRRELIDLYKKAKIFWQATGYRESQLTHPERSEHFGIATIEAMSAWVVPVVFNSGGPVEVIQHGRSGFLWKDLESLRSHTRALMLDSKRLSLLAEQARERSLNYHPSKFFQRADQIFSTVF